jgi:hypothetical protein
MELVSAMGNGADGDGDGAAWNISQGAPEDPAEAVASPKIYPNVLQPIHEHSCGITYDNVSFNSTAEPGA